MSIFLAQHSCQIRILQSDARQDINCEGLVLEVEDLGVERMRVAEAGWQIAEDITERPWGCRTERSTR